MLNSSCVYSFGQLEMDISCALSVCAIEASIDGLLQTTVISLYGIHVVAIGQRHVCLSIQRSSSRLSSSRSSSNSSRIVRSSNSSSSSSSVVVVYKYRSSNYMKRKIAEKMKRYLNLSGRGQDSLQRVHHVACAMDLGIRGPRYSRHNLKGVCRSGSRSLFLLA